MSLKGYESSYYADSANAKKDYPSLQGEVRTDICVIGAGFTGLSAALHLAEKGYSVSLLEAEKVGWGASGRNGGQVCQGHNMGHEEMIAKVGRPAADALWQMSLESVDLVKELIDRHQISCDLKQGVMHVAAKPSHSKELQESVEYKQNVLGYDAIRYVEPSEVADMLGTHRYHAGEYWTEAAHLHPLNYALGLAAAAEKAGVKIYENSRVTEYHAGAGARVKTAEGEVRADYILLACNGYLGKLEPRIAGKIMPINNFILATEPLDEALCRKINRDDLAIADSRFVINYFKLSGDNRLLWGAVRTTPLSSRAISAVLCASICLSFTLSLKICVLTTVGAERWRLRSTGCRISTALRRICLWHRATPGMVLRWRHWEAS